MRCGWAELPDHEAHGVEHASRWAAVSSIAGKIGCTAQTLNEWVKRFERDSGVRAGVPSEVAERLKALDRGRTATSGRSTRSCARRAPILPRRSSTAGSSHDRVHRRSPRGARGRADLQGAADRLWFLKTLSAAKTLLGSSPLLPRYQQTVRVQLTPIVASHRTALKTPGVISIRLKSVVSTDEQGRIVARPEASFGIGRNLPIARERP